MKLTISSHAAFRYMERVRPTLEFDVARAEFEALLDGEFEPSSIPPPWVHEPNANSTWLHLSDGIAACCKGPLVATVLVRGSSHPAHRKYKNQKKAKQRRSRRKPPFKPGMGREAGIRWQ